MDRVHFSNTIVQGFAALRASNGLYALTLVPDLGGKISSLRDLRSGREWLWSSERLPYRRVPYGTSYTREADTGGWDECFPTVAACRYPAAPWQGLAVPDHGELWSQPWQLAVEHLADGGSVLATEVSGVRMPYVFHRSIRLLPGEDRLHITYRAVNLGGAPLLFIWSAHPLFRIEPAMRVLLPEQARLRRYVTVPPDLDLGTEPISWPVRCQTGAGTIDCAPLPTASAGVAFKLWSEPLSAGWAELAAHDGQLRFTFDPSLIPQIGLWLNLGGWAGDDGSAYYNMALEPCIGAQDSLEDAVLHYGQYATLPPRGSSAWWLEVQLRTT